MSRLIDFAGLFPPARLPLRQSLESYLRYKVENDSWMLGRFVCPATRLAEASKLRDQVFSAGPPIEFAALGQGGSNRSDFLQNLVADLESSRAFVTAMDGRALVDVFETRLPEVGFVGETTDSLARFLSEIQSVVDNVWPGELTLFFEPPLSANNKDSLAPLIAALGRIRDSHEPFRASLTDPPGLKLRCGGEDASAIPSIETVALAVSECIRLGVRFKATAGLHHPVRHFNREIGGPQHGFLNLCGAVVLARAGELLPDRIPAMLSDTKIDSFRFEEDSFHWKDLRADTALVARARKDGFVSFGSCSFDEPREDLRKLHLLEDVTDPA